MNFAIGLTFWAVGQEVVVGCVGLLLLSLDFTTAFATYSVASFNSVGGSPGRPSRTGANVLFACTYACIGCFSVGSGCCCP